MINIDLQQIYSGIKQHHTEKWVKPIKMEREETNDNHEDDAKNRQESSYYQVFEALVDTINQNEEKNFAFTV